MTSAKYLGYIGGAAVAVGVGAALATASQGTAHAESDSKAASSESKGPEKGPEKKADTSVSQKADKKKSGANLEKRLDKIADDISTAAKKAPKPKFDPKDAVENLQKQFTTTTKKIAKTESTKVDKAETVIENVVTKPALTPLKPVAELTSKATEAAQALVKLPAPKIDPIDGLAAKATEVAQSLVKIPTINASDAAVKLAAAADSTWFVPNTGPVAWNWNPFREGDPIPQEMPGAIWNLEQTTVNLFSGVPVIQPVVREGFEFGYRVTQMIPWVNVVVPLTNIAQELPDALNGDKAATQVIINNLIVTIAPVSFLFYGYDMVADALNVEYQAQQLKDRFYTTAWDVIDFFGILHPKGQSGLPLSPTAAGSTPSTLQNIQLASKVTALPTAAIGTLADDGAADAFLTNPFRPDDPWPTDMPDSILNIEKTTVAAIEATPLAALAPFYREGFEAAYRFSQMVPYVNAPIPLLAIVRALSQDDPSIAQTTINQLLLTTPPVSLLYYGYDEAADLLNVENQAYELKQDFYATIWDTVDPGGRLHVLGESGI